jgi:hypothetical protein
LHDAVLPRSFTQLGSCAAAAANTKRQILQTYA